MTNSCENGSLEFSDSVTGIPSKVTFIHYLQSDLKHTVQRRRCHQIFNTATDATLTDHSSTTHKHSTFKTPVYDPIEGAWASMLILTSFHGRVPSRCPISTLNTDSLVIQVSSPTFL